MSFEMPLLKFSKTFPGVSKLEARRSLLIFDQILLGNPSIRNWIEQFPFRYPVVSGENLKDLRHFPEHMEKILAITDEIAERPLQLICLGGGSVGDFSGFVASVFKRGVDLIQIPSTWLAAIDSAHGGKNALNVGSIKNQIGTFHFPRKIYLIEELLASQPPERAEEALGEALKISLIQGGPLWSRWRNINQWDAKNLWKFLPGLIDAKYKVVKKDPYEKKGIRHVLNLGHTVGHVFEAELGLPHGRAILAGLGFALQWSQHRKFLKSESLLELPFLVDHKKFLKRLRNSEKYLKQDKKRIGGGKVRFIFLQQPGKTVIQSVLVNDILAEMKRQSQ